MDEYSFTGPMSRVQAKEVLVPPLYVIWYLWRRAWGTLEADGSGGMSFTRWICDTCGRTEDVPRRVISRTPRGWTRRRPGQRHDRCGACTMLLASRGLEMLGQEVFAGQGSQHEGARF